MGHRSLGTVSRCRGSPQALNIDDVERLFCPSDLEESSEANCEFDTSAENSGDAKPERHSGDLVQMEVEEHSLTHCRYMSWCTMCVEAHGREDQHVSVHGCTEVTLRNSADYTDIGEYVANVKRNVATLISRDERTTMIAAFVVNTAGGMEQEEDIRVQGVFRILQNQLHDW